MMEVATFLAGPVQTNVYVAADSVSGEAVIIDPAWDGKAILERVQKRGWKIRQIWVTHAHFDHIAGAAAIKAGSSEPVTIALHPADLPLWESRGGAGLFGMVIEKPPRLDIELENGQRLSVGSLEFEVRHAPGHTPGHVVFYCAAEKAVFCGDVIFAGSIGRTDLPGGDYQTLITSIQQQILTLPDDTRLFSGHGPVTTVGAERAGNPFLGG